MGPKSKFGPKKVPILHASPKFRVFKVFLGILGYLRVFFRVFLGYCRVYYHNIDSNIQISIQNTLCIKRRDNTVFKAFFAFCKFCGIFMKITTKSPKRV